MNKETAKAANAVFWIPPEPTLKQRVMAFLRSLLRRFRRPTGAAPASRPIDVILRGGRYNGKHIDGVIADQVELPIMSSYDVVHPWTVVPHPIELGKCTYHRTTQVLKNGRVVYRQQHPVLIEIRVKIGRQQPVAFSLEYPSQIIFPLEARINKCVMNGEQPPLELVTALDKAMITLMHQQVPGVRSRRPHVQN
jgi:hypothetical protein